LTPGSALRATFMKAGSFARADPLRDRCYLLLLPDLQVFDMCFTLSTFRVCPPLAPLLPIEPEVPEDEEPLLAPPAAEPPEVEPLICTSCPTCSASFDVSPARVYVVPESDVSV